MSCRTCSANSTPAGVVAMGGYNTFCEILTFDKPAVLVPRRRTRAGQYIRSRWVFQSRKGTQLGDGAADVGSQDLRPVRGCVSRVRVQEGAFTKPWYRP